VKLVLALAVVTLALVPQDGAAPKPAKLVVHEWGTFTSVTGGDGVSLEWRPLAGASDLPSFVYQSGGGAKGLRFGEACKGCRHFYCSCGPTCKPGSEKECGCKSCAVASVRMETPVLYFYSDKETTVSVKVDFPKGRITEWYPQARETGAGINWGGVRVMPSSTLPFPREEAESHYYPARETDAAPVRVCGDKVKEHEKFLFYRGVGTFETPLSVVVEGPKLVVRGTDIPRVILFENKGGRTGWTTAARVRGSVTLDRPALGGSADAVMAELEKILVAEGLYAKEAAAMVKTWRDSWFEEGLRVFYIVPRAVTDAVLPIEIEPKPAELVRVLVGRVEILTPELEAKIAALLERLGDASFEKREEATASLRRLGRFAEPALKRMLAKSQDAEVKSRIQTLLGK
jgi:hypothetical protein